MAHRKTGSFYDILGVPPTATPGQIRRAFLDQARRYHPDLNRDDPQAEWQFKRIRRIYEVLIDPLQRAAYDDFPARFSLDDVGADWNNPSTIVTEPSRHRPAEDSAARPRAAGSGQRATTGLWPPNERPTRHRSGLLALSLVVLLLLGVVSWRLPRPTRQPARPPMAKAATPSDPTSKEKSASPAQPKSVTEKSEKPAVATSAEPATPPVPAKGTSPAPELVPDGIDRALRSVPFPTPLAPWDITLPPAVGPESAPLPFLPPSLNRWEATFLDPWPLNRTDVDSIVNAPIGPAAGPAVTVDLPPKPPLTAAPLAPTRPAYDPNLAGLPIGSSATDLRYRKADPFPSAVLPGHYPGAPEMDAVSRENLVIGLRERLNPTGTVFPTFPAGLPTVPSMSLPNGPGYPLTTGPSLTGISPPTAGIPNGLPFLPPSILLPTPVALPQRPAMPTASDVGVSPPYFGPTPPAPRRP